LHLWNLELFLGGCTMSGHFLIEKAYVYPKRTPLKDLKDCEYDFEYGAWFWNFGGCKSVLVKSSNPDKPMPVTKKKDFETGEDQKSE